MKNFLICPVLLAVVCFTGCKDINEISATTENAVPPPQRQWQVPSAYPLNRTITDTSGRTIDATILGKQGISIALSKGSGPESPKFIIPLERLVKDDQAFFESLGDGGKFSQVKEKLEKEARLAGRTARWHMDLKTAEREAAKLDLPLLVAFLVSGSDQSKEIEQRLGYSQEFRNWAAKNLVLCMMKIDDPLSNRTTSYSAVDDRNTAAKYGVANYRTPTVMLVQPDTGMYAPIRPTTLSSSNTAISAVSKALESSSVWTAITAVEAPTKQRASVNSRADSTGSS